MWLGGADRWVTETWGRRAACPGCMVGDERLRTRPRISSQDPENTFSLQKDGIASLVQGQVHGKWMLCRIMVEAGSKVAQKQFCPDCM